jgi:hypothetical protein
MPALSSLWGAQTRSRACRSAVFMNEPAESIPATDASRLGRRDQAEGGTRLRRHELETAMRSMPVVVLYIGMQRSLELACGVRKLDRLHAATSYS